MTGHEIVSIFVGIAVIAAIVMKRNRAEQNSFTNRMPELILGIYLIAQGIFAAIPSMTGRSLANNQSLAFMLLLLPAAAAIGNIRRDEQFSPISAFLWLISGILIAAGSMIMRSWWHLGELSYISESMPVILFFAIAMFFFDGLRRFILGLAIILWIFNLLKLTESAFFAISITIGIITLFFIIHDLEKIIKKPFGFDLDGFLNAIGNPFMILNPSGKIIYVNDEFLKLSGREKDSMLQTDAIELFDIPSDWRFKASSGEKLCQVRCHLIGRDGARIPVVLWLNEILNSRKTICNLLCIIHQVKELELLENRIKNESIRFTALYETSLALSSSLEIKDVLKSIASAAESLTKGDTCTILSLDHARQILKPIYSSEESFNAEVMNFEMSVGQGLTGTVVSDGKPRIQNFDDEISWGCWCLVQRRRKRSRFFRCR